MVSAFVYVLAVVGLLVVSMLASTLLACVGRERLFATVGDLRTRLTSIAPYVLLVLVVLLVNKGTQVFVVELSWALTTTFGYNLTTWIYGVEGAFVPVFQSMMPTYALIYFSFIYVVGYVFLLVFPLLAYLALPSLRRLKELLVAYGVNYVVGVLCYALFVAYGPRNVMPDAVDQPLFELFPEVFLLTSAVNTNTNVFPSLHTSLAVTVVLFAWYTHEEYPRWTPIATVVGASVVLATMALGIHWLVDVLAGVVLAVVAVSASSPLVDRFERWTARRQEGVSVLWT